MITINSNKGVFQARGPFDEILCEWTLITRIILKELRAQFPEETANELFADLGRIAAENVEEVNSTSTLFEKIENRFEEVLANETEV